MLERMESKINEVKAGPNFSEFYSRYIREVQDRNLEDEIEYLLGRNVITPLKLDALINHTLKGLTNL